MIVEYMEQLTKSQFDLKYYITAEKSESSAWYREGYYEQLSSLGIIVDIRKFKQKQVFCPNKDCDKSKSGF